MTRRMGSGRQQDHDKDGRTGIQRGVPEYAHDQSSDGAAARGNESHEEIRGTLDDGTIGKRHGVGQQCRPGNETA